MEIKRTFLPSSPSPKQVNPAPSLAQGFGHRILTALAPKETKAQGADEKFRTLVLEALAEQKTQHTPTLYGSQLTVNNLSRVENGYLQLAQQAGSSQYTAQRYATAMAKRPDQRTDRDVEAIAIVEGKIRNIPAQLLGPVAPGVNLMA